MIKNKSQVLLNKIKLGNPDAVRVWRGFRSEKYISDQQKFANQLGAVFIPITVQLLEPLGLLAYIPTFISSGIDAVPDEIALVFYETQDDYYSITRNTVVGRAYGMLHGNIFNFKKAQLERSRSSFPLIYINKIELGNAYYLMDSKVNWRDGLTNIYVGLIENTANIDIVIKKLNSAILEMKKGCKNNFKAINGSILYIEQNYLIYWENTLANVKNSESVNLLALFKMLTKSVYDGSAKNITVSSILEGNDNKIEITDSVSFNVLLDITK